MSKKNNSIENKVVKTKKNSKTKILTIVLGIVFVIFISIYVYANGLLADARNLKLSEHISSGLKDWNIISDLFKAPSKQVNFVVLGVDNDGTRTDLMIVGRFNSETNKIDLISMPRDTYVEFTKAEQEFLIKNGKFVPSKGYLKLNEVHHYAGQEMGTDFTVSKIESLLGIKIEYYAKINLEGFREFVDKIGGVEFDVPQRMIYDDPVQDLHINLKPGIQVLDGNQAEGLIRYRKTNSGMESESPSYRDGDLQRVEIQQQFVKAVISQAIAKKNILNNIPAVLTTMDEHFSTNFNVNEIPKYSTYFKNFSSDNIVTHTLPVDMKNIGGLSFVVVRETETKELVKNIFYSVGQDSNKSLDKSIQVLNGGYTKGIAGKAQSMLISAGYNIEEIGDYNSEQKNETYIYVKESGIGNDLLEYFTDAVIVTDPDMFPMYDITIVIGTDFKI